MKLPGPPSNTGAKGSTFRPWMVVWLFVVVLPVAGATAWEVAELTSAAVFATGSWWEKLSIVVGLLAGLLTALFVFAVLGSPVLHGRREANHRSPQPSSTAFGETKVRKDTVYTRRMALVGPAGNGERMEGD